MVLYKWTQFYITKFRRDASLHCFRHGRSYYSFVRNCVQVGPSFVLDGKYYGFLSITVRRFTSRFIADHNVHRNNNFFNLA